MIIAKHYNYTKYMGNSRFNFDLQYVLKCIEEEIFELNSEINLVYLKDINSNTLMKIELIDNELVISYILDLFDFEKEFKE